MELEAKISVLGPWTLLRLPLDASLMLPSRGMTAVKGTINGAPFLRPLEPDGVGSHWLKLDEAMLDECGAQVGETVTLEIEPTNDWPEPEVPTDLEDALETSARAKSLWSKTTTIARWDWIRWIRSTAYAETRKHRVEVAISKMEAGSKRPCCFNRSMCTVPEISKNGILLDESELVGGRLSSSGG